MVSDITVTGTVQKAQKTEAQSIKLAEDFSQFLTLLTTQLQNQDPLSPMDSTEFTNQLVQFSQVEQSINTNQKLDDLLSLQLGSISSVALGYVGMDISYVSAEMNYNGSKPVDINYSLTSNATTVKINIYNEQGQVVRTIDAPKTVGAQKITWDGKDNNGNTSPEGTYSVKIDALDKDNAAMKVSSVVSGNVRGIESQNGVVYLLVGERAVSLGSVIQASNPVPPVEEEA
ncbi:MAG: flagellar hook assembly protein FlgD [Micavibrio sp.]